MFDPIPSGPVAVGALTLCRQSRLPFPAAVTIRRHSDGPAFAQTDYHRYDGDELAADVEPDDEWGQLLAAAEQEERAEYHAVAQTRFPRLGPRRSRDEGGHPRPPPSSVNQPAKIIIPPEGQPLPEGLPTGFREMTLEEQEEELWIVSQEDRLGAEWDLDDPGKHRPYTNDYPPYSPAKVIGMLHRWRNRSWTPREWRLARAIASNRSLRTPIITAQAMLRRYALLARREGIKTKIERYLGSTEEWKFRLDKLTAQTGITEADIKQWLWILHPQEGDMQLRRFFKSNCRKPIFLLTLLLARDKSIRDPLTFMAVLKYIRDNYISLERPSDELASLVYQGQGRSMSWWHFLVVLYRLAWHARETWPAAMTLISRLTADYIAIMPPDRGGRALTGYQARSLVFNKALQYFAWPARIRPLDHREHNWAAQRHLLRLAASVDPPLMMDHNSYRSIRAVLIGMSKNKAEAKNADRTAKTWPPYRRALDGIDERRNLEDDLSKSVKTGLLAREAGYNDDIVDRALSALGGSGFGDSPSIQTRSLPPPMFSGNRANQNIFSEWAALVKATRNAREAWIMFESPPRPGLRPNSQVYAEMFEKLFARPVTDSPTVRPGDAKEVFPVHDGNLSEFEIARLTPPSPEELYDLMLRRDNIKPAGYCLVVLVENARSRTEALRYLRDSPWEPYIEALGDTGTWVNRTAMETTRAMRKLSTIPIAVFNAWISMLCRIHTRTPREGSLIGNLGPTADVDRGTMPVHEHRVREISKGASIVEAIELTKAFHSRNAKVARHDKKPWHLIMQALAGPKLLYSPLGAAFNILKTLTWFLDIYERTTASKGIDPVSFEALCLMIRKTLKLSTFVETNGEVTQRGYIAGNPHIDKLIVRAHRLAIKAFKDLTVALPTDTEEGIAEEEGEDEGPPRGMLRYNVSGRPLYRYMMALGCCGNEKEMVRVMDWILDGWDLEHIRESAKSPTHLDYHYLIRTLAYFIEVARQLADPYDLERIRHRLEQLVWKHECTWFWPDEGWRVQTRVASEADTDLQIVERWGQIRDMLSFSDPTRESATTLADLIREMPMEFRELERPPER
ncbi:hypothetical protein MMYC01_207319 [Madurella mycetomatis]|uniref:Uncharacterized protein n=1 Tax=Madurella mycetomatis TaxID=100816 RepID=A0A175VYH8_9PEZI|nr:hypothetical protein MMYC01_207319 [Madurella mycetomatis]